MTTVREPQQQAGTKRAADLKRGDVVAPGELSDTPIEILLAEPYAKDRMLVVHRSPVDSEPTVQHVFSNMTFRLATEAEVEAIRDAIERARKIAQIRQLADWFESNPWVPMPWMLRAAESLSVPDDAPTVEAAIAKVHEVAQRLGVEVNEKSDKHTSMEFKLGDFVEYTLSAYHPKGRPAEPEQVRCVASLHVPAQTPDDPTGLRYTRDDDGDEPTAGLELTDRAREVLAIVPVSPARVPMHIGVVDDEEALRNA